MIEVPLLGSKSFLDRGTVQDNLSSMKAIAKREAASKPARLTGNRAMGRDGGLVANAKSRRLSLDEMEADLARLGKGCPKIDTLALHQEGE